MSDTFNKNFDIWLASHANYDAVTNQLYKAIKFYGETMPEKLVKFNVELSVNDKTSHGNRKLGCFSPYAIEFYNVKELVQKNQFDVVVVHELAHFWDKVQCKNTRYRHSSSIRDSRERFIAETFRREMDPIPEKRTNYRGRTCELFARAVEEYYAIITDNTSSLSRLEIGDWYVQVDRFKKTVMPVLDLYFKQVVGKIM